MQIAEIVEISIVVWSRYNTLKLFWIALENDVLNGARSHTFHQAFYKNFVTLLFWNKYSPFVSISIMIDWKLGPILGILYFYLTRNYTRKIPQLWKFVKDHITNKIQEPA